MAGRFGMRGGLGLEQAGTCLRVNRRVGRTSRACASSYNNVVRASARFARSGVHGAYGASGGSASC